MMIVKFYTQFMFKTVGRIFLNWAKTVDSFLFINNNLGIMYSDVQMVKLGEDTVQGLSFLFTNRNK